MSGADFTKRGPVQTQIVRIMEVVPADRRITGVLKDGGRVDIAVFGTGSTFQWPKVEEVWRIRYDQGFWYLDSRFEYNNTAKIPVETINPGETRIAGDTVHTDNHLHVGGNAAVDGSLTAGPITASGNVVVPNLLPPSGTAITSGAYILVRKWTQAFSGTSPWTFAHNLNTTDVNVTLTYSPTAFGDSANWSLSDANHVTITINDNGGSPKTVSGKIVILG